MPPLPRLTDTSKLCKICLERFYEDVDYQNHCAELYNHPSALPRKAEWEADYEMDKCDEDDSKGECLQEGAEVKVKKGE